VKTFRIALIPGDGIGPEILREGKKVMDAVAEVIGITWQWKEYPFGAEHWLKHRNGLPTLFSEEDMKELGTYDAIYFGSVGDRGCRTCGTSGALLWMRFYFDQYINLRPAKLLRGIESPLRGKRPHEIDMYMVRENSEDFYIGLGGHFAGTKNSENLKLLRALYQARFKVEVTLEPGGELAYQIGVLTGLNSERVIRYGFELAKRKKLNRVTVVHKANVLTKIYGLWIEKAERVAKDYTGIELELTIADATSMWLVRRPEWFQVIVAPNMFGDILSDLAASTVGGLGFAPGGNINPDRKAGVSMFEPIHGSAPSMPD